MSQPGRKILRLTPDQAKTLANWLRTAARAMEAHADELEEAAQSHTLHAALRTNAQIDRDNAAHARRLADRLDPEYAAMLARLDTARAQRAGRRR